MNTRLTTLGLVIALAACKPPKTDSDVKAITGLDNGKEKAFALVAVRNEWDFEESINVKDKPQYKSVLKKMNEPVFALVECQASSVNGETVKAETWVNYVEYMSFLGLLYVDKNRTIGYYVKGDSKRRNPDCRVIGERMLTLPLVLNVSSNIMAFPKTQPAVGSKKYMELQDEYLMIQGIYLALRGPYTATGEVSISPKFVAMSEAAANYESVSVTARSLGKAFIAADEYYNPCYEKNSNQAGLQYLRAWRNENFACVDAVVSGLKNYRAGGAKGARYVEIRDKLIVRIGSLYRETFISSAKSTALVVNDVMTTTQPWADITGDSASFAKAAAGLAPLGGSGSSLSLTGGGDEMPSFFLGPDSTRTTTTPRETTALVDLLAKFNTANGLTMENLAPYFQADFGRVAQIKKQSPNAELLFNDHLAKEAGANGLTKYKDDIAKLQAAMKAGEVKGTGFNQSALDKLTGAYNDVFESRTEDFAKQMKAVQALSLYSKISEDSGVKAYKNSNGDIVTKGEKFDDGKARDYRKLAENPAFKAQWTDKTASNLSTDTSAVERLVGWDKDGKGFQKVSTASLQTTTEDGQTTKEASLPGLEFNYGFKPNKPGSSVGTFTADPAMLTDTKNGYQAQVNNLVSAVQKQQGIQGPNEAATSAEDQGMRQVGLGNEDATIRQNALSSNWSVFTNGLSQMGQSMTNQQSVVQAQQQISTQQKFASDQSVSGILDNASSTLAQTQSQNYQMASTGFQQAATATSDYFKGAYQAGGNSYLGGAKVAFSDTVSSVSGWFGGGGSSSSSGGTPPASNPAPAAPAPAAPAPVPAPAPAPAPMEGMGP